MEYHLGLDSTDSNQGGCTTWTLSRVLDQIEKDDESFSLLDYPQLIRLNPNIVQKTRGNGALALHFLSKLDFENLFSSIKQIVQTDYDSYRLDDLKPPGIILIQGSKPKTKVYRDALKKIIKLDEVLSEIKDRKNILYWPKNSESLIGAYSAVTANLTEDYTFELLAYRNKNEFGKPRLINIQALIEIEKKVPSIFSSFDFKTRRELIAPSTSDPVFFGLRGENPQDLLTQFSKLPLEEQIASWTIFRTNQATNAHVEHPTCKIRDQCVISAQVIAHSTPIILKGGHIKGKIRFRQSDGLDYSSLDFIAFEPTKELAKNIRFLAPGDQIFIHGNVRENQFGLHVALEYVEIMELSVSYEKINPKCKCGRRMTKVGKFKGYKCKSCNFKSYIPIRKKIERQLFIGQKIFPSLSAQRHLTRPRMRMHRRNQWNNKFPTFVRQILTKDK